ncbi:hypothetical protein, partial [Escherichia coli]|uniref:hypothetical protein n=1 Tax=Escherichia coli TaxID=562 RepID=UPI0032B340C5
HERKSAPTDSGQSRTTKTGERAGWQLISFSHLKIAYSTFSALTFRTTAAWRLQIENRPGSSCCCRTPRRICML